MIRDVLSSQSDEEPRPIRMAAWIAIVTAATVAFSLSLACATPLAAVAALAGARVKLREGVWLVLAAWLANQLVGYCLLNYPRSWDSFAWGAALCVAGLSAALGAREAARMARAPLLIPPVAFLAAFLIYEAALFAATALLPSAAEAFSSTVIARIFMINAGAVIGLAAMRWLAVRIGLQPRNFPEHVALSPG
jgi:hypothetical protein